MKKKPAVMGLSFLDFAAIDLNNGRPNMVTGAFVECRLLDEAGTIEGRSLVSTMDKDVADAMPDILEKWKRMCQEILAAMTARATGMRLEDVKIVKGDYKSMN